MFHVTFLMFFYLIEVQKKKRGKYRITIFHYTKATSATQIIIFNYLSSTQTYIYRVFLFVVSSFKRKVDSKENSYILLFVKAKNTKTLFLYGIFVMVFFFYSLQIYDIFSNFMLPFQKNRTKIRPTD